MVQATLAQMMAMAVVIPMGLATTAMMAAAMERAVEMARMAVAAMAVAMERAAAMAKTAVAEVNDGVLFRRRCLRGDRARMAHPECNPHCATN